MSSLGYCPPHQCEYCRKVFLDFNPSQPWDKLKVLHKRIEIWPAAWTHGAPSWILPFHIPLSSQSSKLYKQLLPAGSPDLNQLYRLELEKRPDLLGEATKNAGRYLFLDITFEECSKLAEKGCTLFARILEGDNRTKAPKLKEVQSQQFIVAIEERFDRLVFGFPVFGQNYLQGIDIQPILTFDRLAPPGDPSEQVLSKRRINLYPQSSQSISQVLKWLVTCQQEHPLCNFSSTEFKPLRLLEIYRERNERYVKLVWGKSSHGSGYAALSYCWGHQKTFVAKKKNEVELQKGVHLDRFPSTLRDAISMSEALGISFLWIDAFCILQDDDNEDTKAEKNRELGKMADIYRNAIVTIAASRSSGTNEGFLHERQPIGFDSPNSVFQLQYDNGMRKTGSIVLYPFEAEPSEPLDKRAWVMQERMVSRRVIDLGSRQTTWVCCTPTYETLTDGWTPTVNINWERSYKLFKDFQDLSPRSDPNMASTLWHRAVEEYTSRQISKPRDRLPAIAAVAQQFYQYLGPKYLAGVWSKDLALDLLWEVREPILKVKETEYLGPSWSWVTLNKPVRYKSYMVHEEDGTPVVLPTIDVSFRILDSKVNLSSSFQFGEVTHGTLKLVARYQTALWLPGDQKCNSKQVGTLLNEKHQLPLPAHFIVDSYNLSAPVSAEEPAIQVYLMVIITNPDYNFSMSDGYSTQFGFDTLAGAERSRRKQAGKYDAEAKQYYPPTRPFSTIKGLVLRKLDSGSFSRLGVFEFDHHYSELYKKSLNSRGWKWNDCFSEFHAHTQSMMEGEVKEFTIV